MTRTVSRNGCGSVAPQYACGRSGRHQKAAQHRPDATTDRGRRGHDADSTSCPATPARATAQIQAGCAESQRDADGDGVSDSLDECPATPSPVNRPMPVGCSEGQRDDDGDSDGIPNADDTCAATEKAGSAANDEGCSVIQEQLADLGDDLANLDGLDEDDRSLASAIDGACERLIRFESARETLHPIR